MAPLHWNPALESLAPEASRKLEAPLLARQVEYLYRHSDYYRDRLEAAGLGPRDINCHEALEAVPLTDKHELAAAQRDGMLIGPHQCAGRDKIARLVGTGGSSGKPMRIAWTAADLATYNEMGARALWITGCRPGDLVINCFNYSLYAGGVMDHMSFETLGASTLAYGVGRSRELLALLADLPGDKCLYATPSYAVRLAEVAAEIGVEPRSLGISKGIFSGEAGLQVPGYRSRIEQTWGLRSHDLYGIAELGCQSAECEQRAGMHYCGTGLVIAELIDPVTAASKPMRDGEQGELVYTSIKREASPMLRLRSHDQVEVQTSPCACGRTSFRFHALGRSDDMFVVKGVNIFPASVQRLLVSMRPQLTGEFRIELDRPPPFDYAPRLLVEIARELPVAYHPALLARAEQEIYKAMRLHCRAEAVPQGTIASEHKTKRVLHNYEASCA